MPKDPDELSQLVGGLSVEGREQLLAQLRGPARALMLAADLEAAQDAVRQAPDDPAVAESYEQASVALAEHRATMAPVGQPLVGGDAVVTGEEG
ncbi:hypothetical protein [Frankia sp. AgB32]|uniref:hypothetical protein n=1 Tax=Frankia sp. AgB32 TaxID=631119 RepID=UPI00201039C2|nr:hypothetical protein [Frankia sp. AgB32]MCK9896966.1 hypothetical protein [Frankia sp. AgB32]